MRTAKALVVAIAAALAAGAAHAAPTSWLATWGASPQASGVGGPPGAVPLAINDQTIRQVVRISAGGRRVRVRLSNEFGSKPLDIGAAHIAIAGEGGAIRPGTDRVLTFGGRPGATIPAGAPLLSDPVEVDAAALASLSVSLYVRGEAGACTCHGAGMQTAYVSDKGDFTGAESFPPVRKSQARAFLSGVEVSGGAPGKAIVVLGDSISDGVGSTPDANHRWPDLLAERLAKRGGGAWGVINEGISGNRLLHDGAGVSALARFDRDVLAQPGAAYVILFEAINDIGLSHLGAMRGPMAETMHAMAGPPVGADDLIAADKQLIARAHAQGLKIYAVTITPYGGAAYASPEGEVDREKLNAWIRTSKAFDGVIDFDAVWRDPANPTQIKAGLHAGDHLHGSDAGYRAAADAIDLGLFR
jgi:lysophospholipase L1-like esterase